MDDYFSDKKAIYLYQKPQDYLIINENLKPQIALGEIKSRVIFFNSRSFPGQLLHLKGVHSLENVAAALEVGKVLNLDMKQCIDTLVNFKGLPYRQQIIGEKDGIIFINDTTSTTPTATIKALDAFSDKPIVLVLGGNSKRLPTNVLIDRLIGTFMIILLKGSFTDEILPILKEKYPGKITEPYADLEKAVIRACEESLKVKKSKRQKVYILFSPGATSFAMFNNEFHRGDEFNRIVKNMMQIHD